MAIDADDAGSVLQLENKRILDCINIYRLASFWC